jgi:hypothetical protein
MQGAQNTESSQSPQIHKLLVGTEVKQFPHLKGTLSFTASWISAGSGDDSVSGNDFDSAGVSLVFNWIASIICIKE